MKTKDILIYSTVFSAIAAVLLFIATGEQPDGYYTFLRIATTISALIAGFAAFKSDAHVIVVVAVLIALLFNPFVPIQLDKDIWQQIDIFAGIVFLAMATTFYLELRKSQDR